MSVAHLVICSSKSSPCGASQNINIALRVWVIAQYTHQGLLRLGLSSLWWVHLELEIWLSGPLTSTLTKVSLLRLGLSSLWWVHVELEIWLSGPLTSTLTKVSLLRLGLSSLWWVHVELEIWLSGPLTSTLTKVRLVRRGLAVSSPWRVLLEYKYWSVGLSIAHIDMYTN